MNSLRCSNCSLVDFATASACKRCGMPFDSTAAAEWDARPPAQSAAQPQPNESYFWDQPSYRPNYEPPPTPASSVGRKIIALLVVVAVVGLVTFIAIPKLLKKSSEFKNLSWTEYKSPDGTFSVSLPAAPKETQMSIPSAFGNAQAHILEASVSKAGGCMVMYAQYPSINPNVSEETIYDMAVAGATRRQTTMKLGARRYITHEGHRGVEVDLSSADAKLSAVGGVRIFWVSPRLYVLGAGGPNTEEFKAVQARCFNSFRLQASR
jgi:hypothetical protein